MGGVNRNFDKISFHPYFSSKDLFVFFFLELWGIRKILFQLIPLLHQSTFNLNAIFRSIPNKLGGVVALAISIIILIICPFMYKRKFRGFIFYPINKFLFLLHINI